MVYLISSLPGVENVKALTEATLEYGVYSQAPSTTLVEPFRPDIPGQNSHAFAIHPHKPGVCVPWEEKCKEFPAITGEVSRVQKMWESVDAFGYAFIWTNLTW